MGIEQLDLVVYDSALVSWWQPFVIIAVLVIVAVFLGLSGWWFFAHMRHRFTHKRSIDQVVLEILHETRQRFERRQITASQVMGVVTSLLKMYSAHVCARPAIRAMTDQQWLDDVPPLFQAALPDCQYIVQVALKIKFNHAAMEPAVVLDVVDRACRTVQMVHDAIKKKTQSL